MAVGGAQRLRIAAEESALAGRTALAMRLHRGRVAGPLALLRLGLVAIARIVLNHARGLVVRDHGLGGLMAEPALFPLNLSALGGGWAAMAVALALVLLLALLGCRRIFCGGDGQIDQRVGRAGARRRGGAILPHHVALTVDVLPFKLDVER